MKVGGLDHGGAGGDLDDVGVGLAHHGDDLGPDRRRVAGHQDRSHGLRLTGNG